MRDVTDIENVNNFINHEHNEKFENTYSEMTY